MKLPRFHKHYYLGMAADRASGGWLKHLFTVGRRKDYDALITYLGQRYKGEAVLCKNGRSALALALKAYFEPGDEILVNGFTCYAVYEAVKAAGLKPIFVDIDMNTLNFTVETLANAKTGRLEVVRDNGSEIVSESRNRLSKESSEERTTSFFRDDDRQATLVDGRERSGPRDDWSRVRGMIIQNTLGNPVDIKTIEAFAEEHGLIIIEDLAHCAGIRYSDKREAGTVGAACVLSFGKDKSIDTVSGGAVVFRGNKQSSPNKLPRFSDHLRARFYPMFGAMSRGLTYVGLGGALMRGLVAIHWVEKSADNKLDLERRPSKFEAKLALRQFKELRKNGEPPLREFYYVRDRAKMLKELQKSGYYFGGFWYERPVSPERYYKKVDFPESDCPNAVYAAEHIVNLPNYYTCRDLAPARKIIKEYQEEGINESE